MSEDEELLKCPFCLLEDAILLRVNTPIGDRFQCEKCKTLFDEKTVEALNAGNKRS